MTSCFALVDCNNFYASCERLFNPSVKCAPIIVLSNNDGCVISRSEEAKELGIEMAVPAFKIKKLIRKHQVKVFSSNYALYNDISSRVMSTLESMAPQIEFYSIDEAFLDFSGFSSLGTLNDYGQKIRKTVAQHVGVSACVGLGPTKTLAKLASHAAKKYPATGGVVDLTDPTRQHKLLNVTSVGEVWGVGRKNAEKLEQMGVKTVLQLAQMSEASTKRHFSIALVKTIDELNGQIRFALDESPTARKQLMCSRSFGTRITAYRPLREAVCEFTARVAERLRNEGQVCGVVTVSIQTGACDVGERAYSNTATARLPSPDSDTRAILKVATGLFDSIWKEGYRYAKARVMLTDFSDPNNIQLDLFTEPAAQINNDDLMSVIDNINQGGRGKVWFGSQRSQEDWFMKRAHLSPAYTTRWEDLPLVN